MIKGLPDPGNLAVISLVIFALIFSFNKYYIDAGGGDEAYLMPTRRFFDFQVLKCDTLMNGNISCDPAVSVNVYLYRDGFLYSLGPTDLNGFVKSRVPLESGDQVLIRISFDDKHYYARFTVPRIYPADTDQIPVVTIHIVDGEEVRVDA